MARGAFVASIITLLFVAAVEAADTVTPDLIAKAKAEGEVVWYSTLPIPETQAWSSLFTKQYGIKVNLFRTGATGMTQKLSTEIPAGRWGFDIVMNRGTNIELYKKRGWLQKLNYPERKQFIEGFIDPDDYWGTYYTQFWGISYNTSLVKPNEAPKSYDDVFHPRWKGMTTFDEQDVDLYVTLLKIMGREKGRDWLRRAVANGLRTRQGHTMEVQLVSAGEFALGLSTYVSIAEQFRARGAPVDWVAVEPVPVNTLGLAISAKPPHPNAARLFINWGLSVAGLKAMNEISDRVPARRDVPLKNKRLEQTLQRKLMPVDLAIAEKYAEYNQEFLGLLKGRN
jgi:iron(III) transport system substrate-binding protein